MLLLVASLSACSTGYVMVAARPPPQYTTLGPTEGKYCGQFSALRRFQGAYANALAKVPGARSLVQVELQEEWRWWGLGFENCAIIRGQAIR